MRCEPTARGVWLKPISILLDTHVPIYFYNIDIIQTIYLFSRTWEGKLLVWWLLSAPWLLGLIVFMRILVVMLVRVSYSYVMLTKHKVHLYQGKLIPAWHSLIPRLLVGGEKRSLVTYSEKFLNEIPACENFFLRNFLAPRISCWVRSAPQWQSICLLAT